MKTLTAYSIGILLMLLTYNKAAASDILQIKVKIIKINQMPLNKAIAFCNAHKLSCYSVRERYLEQKELDEEKRKDFIAQQQYARAVKK